MAADTVRKLTDPQGTSPVEQKSAPLISRKMLLFMVAMVLANTGGSMYGLLLPLYLISLNASVVQIGLFFTLSQIVPLALQILGGWISDSLGRLRSIAMGQRGGSVFLPGIDPCADLAVGTGRRRFIFGHTLVGRAQLQRFHRRGIG